jgi:hypothetical protein
MDMTETIAPRSDQINADDLMAGPVTVTIREVARGSAEQPVDVHLVEFPGRAYRPSKSMRRVMVLAWGPEASAYAGRRLTLVRNPDITFGKDKVGGIEIAAMSDIPKPLTAALTATRGKRRSFTVQPLADVVKRDFLAEAKLAGGDVESLKALWSAASQAGAPQEVLDQIRAQAAPVEAPTPAL